MRSLAATVFAVLLVSAVRADDPWVVYQGGDGPGKGKHIVLVSGDEEYRSEEMLPQLGKILAKRHGFTCTILFAIDPKDGTIDPGKSNIPGLEKLASADLAILFIRFRNLPDEQMKHLVDYIESGKPIIGLRTATHAFSIPKGKTYSKYSYNSPDSAYSRGFGRQVLGETWVNHHGAHGKESTRGILNKEQATHPILKGIKDGDIWGPSDVYTVNLPGDCVPLVYGQVLTGMKPDDPPVTGKKNDPMMPIAWTKPHKVAGKDGRTFTCTTANGQDFLSAGLRRLLVNASYWGVGLEDRIDGSSNVDLVGDYQPLRFAGGGHRKGVRPADLQMK
jgi:hypothetical protein